MLQILYSFELAEKAMIFLPVLSYWVYSLLLTLIQITTMFKKLEIDTTHRPQNKPSTIFVFLAVVLQHAIQIATAVVLVFYSRPKNVKEWKIEEPPLFLLKIILSAIILDAYQYWLHRYMHQNRFLYRHIHSIHHSITVPYSFSALYNHPVEGFLMDTIGGAIPSLLLNMHPWTCAVFYSIATLKTVDDHSGFEWNWSPSRFWWGFNGSRFHDTHHWGKGRMYNFSQPFFTFWDFWMGTEYETSMAAKLAQKKLALNSKENLQVEEKAELMDSAREMNVPKLQSKKGVLLESPTRYNLRARKSRTEKGLATPETTPERG